MTTGRRPKKRFSPIEKAVIAESRRLQRMLWGMGVSTVERGYTGAGRTRWTLTIGDPPVDVELFEFDGPLPDQAKLTETVRIALRRRRTVRATIIGPDLLAMLPRGVWAKEGPPRSTVEWTEVFKDGQPLVTIVTAPLELIEAAGGRWLYLQHYRLARAVALRRTGKWPYTRTGRSKLR